MLDMDLINKSLPSVNEVSVAMEAVKSSVTKADFESYDLEQLSNSILEKLCDKKRYSSFNVTEVLMRNNCYFGIIVCDYFTGEPIQPEC